MPTEAPIAFGSGIPKWVGGITNAFRYRGINLSVLVDFKLGHYLMSGTNFNAWRHGHHKGTLKGREQGCVVGEGVTPDGEENTTCAPLQPFYETVGPQSRRADFVYNAGFWKLRQVTLSYDLTRILPESSLAGLFGTALKGLNVSLVGDNLLVFKDWTENIDPEQGVYSSDTQVGMEANGLPMTRGIGFNIEAQF